MKERGGLDTCGIMVIIVRNEHSNSSSNLDEAVSISLSANTLRKDMNSKILSPATGKK